jgi:hypothetical protein
VEGFEAVPKLKYVNLTNVNLVIQRPERTTYLGRLRKINEHDSTRPLLATCRVEAYSCNYTHPSTLNEIIHRRKLENLHAAVDYGVGDPVLYRKTLHDPSS